MRNLVFPREFSWREDPLSLSVLSLLTLAQGSMPTDGTLLLEQLPKEKQYLVTALSVFFSVGSVVSAVVALLVLPNNSCPLVSSSAELRLPSTLAPPPCDVETQNLGWKYVLITHALLVRITTCFSSSPTHRGLARSRPWPEIRRAHV